MSTQKNEDVNGIKLTRGEIVFTVVVVLVACIGIIFFTIYPKPSLALSGGIVAIICAMTGIWITVAVTRLLLDKQVKTQAELQKKQNESQAELQKQQNESQQSFQTELQKMQAELQDKQNQSQQVFQVELQKMQAELQNKQNQSQQEFQMKLQNMQAKTVFETKIFEEQLKTYQKFLDKLGNMVKQEDKVKEEDVKELIFQIALVSMHIESKIIKDLFFALSTIIEDKNDVNSNKTPDIKLQELTIHVLAVIKILQKELYKNLNQQSKDEAVNQESKDKEYEKSIEILAMTFFGMLRNEKDSDVIPVEKFDINNIEAITKNFETTLEAKLRENYPSINNMNIELKGKATPCFIVKSKEWGDDYHFRLNYEGNDKLFFAIHGADENDYRDMYISMRRKWGGYFNRYNWYMILKEPYNNWVYTDEGQKLFSNPDEDLLSYITDLFIRSIKYYIQYRIVLTLRDKLKEELEKNNMNLEKENLEVGFYLNNCLVHDYKFTDNGKERWFAIDTAMADDSNQWEITLFVRNDNPEIIKTYFPDIFKRYNNAMPKEKGEGVGRYILKSYPIDEDLSVIATDLVEIRKLIEKRIESIQ